MTSHVKTATSTQSDSGASARERLVTAAVAAFSERGFHATTTRDIAARAGMSPAAVYVHHASKEELLFAISRDGHAATLGSIRTAATQEDPVRRLQDVVRAFTTWHAEHHAIARIVQYELGALKRPHFAEVAAMRRDIEQVMRATLTYGVHAGRFEVPDVRGTARALLSLGVDVARWYREDGPMSVEELGDLYADLAVRMVLPR
jgi:AcrR family transcriptional regulator